MLFANVVGWVGEEAPALRERPREGREVNVPSAVPPVWKWRAVLTLWSLPPVLPASFPPQTLASCYWALSLFINDCTLLNLQYRDAHLRHTSAIFNFSFSIFLTISCGLFFPLPLSLSLTTNYLIPDRSCLEDACLPPLKSAFIAIRFLFSTSNFLVSCVPGEGHSLLIQGNHATNIVIIIHITVTCICPFWLCLLLLFLLLLLLLFTLSCILAMCVTSNQTLITLKHMFATLFCYEIMCVHVCVCVCCILITTWVVTHRHTLRTQSFVNASPPSEDLKDRKCRLQYCSPPGSYTALGDRHGDIPQTLQEDCLSASY